ncbi:MAG: hypothetical protein DRQ88_09035 [Epsilonproteobacteria bacterium]|nr:MAG: hypothetical protein DRQ88_09035 [Campylobacterota bacterium]
MQKSLFLNMKKKALSFEGKITDELKSYRRAQKRYANRSFETSTLIELFESIEDANIIFLGDFHTFDQNTKNFERILKALIKKDKKLAFGLEFIFASKQKYIDLYLAGHLSELEFLESIDYFQSWRFPWKHYSFLFNFAKKNRVPILALNSNGTLDKRDQFASDHISYFLKDNPEYKMLVLFGELHIMPNKIPKLVTKSLGPDFKQLIIHQNLDDVFWKLNESSIIRFNELEFSLQASPPWIKYESMIYWLENILEDPEFDLHEYILEKKGNLNSGDLSEKFLFLCLKINEGLSLDLEVSKLENFNIFDYHQMEIVLEKLNKNNKLDYFYKKLITNGKSFCIPESSDYYLPNSSVNKVSMIIGLHLKNILNESVPLSENNSDFFCRFIGNFFIAHFCSKILNPYKKCDLYLDLLKNMASSGYTQEEKVFYKSSIKILNDLSNNIDISTIIEGQDFYVLYSLAEIIGPLLGDIYYQNIDSYNGEVREYIQNKLLYSNPTLEELPNIFNIIFDDLKLNISKKDYF